MPSKRNKKANASSAPTTSKVTQHATITQSSAHFFHASRTWADVLKPAAEQEKMKQQEEKIKQQKQTVLAELLQHKDECDETTLAFSPQPADGLDKIMRTLEQIQIENRKKFAMAGATVAGVKNDLKNIHTRLDKLEALLEAYLNAQSTSSELQPSMFQLK